MDIENTIPGQKIEQEEARSIIKEFKEHFRKISVGTPDNLPTACLLEGEEVPDVFQGENFLNREELYLLFEYDNDLRKTSGAKIGFFVTNLQPWEDYDLCVFDATMRWCIGLSHNGVIKLSSLPGSNLEGN